MKIALTGASGFIGRRLIERLRNEGHSLRAFGRRPPRRDVEFVPWQADGTQISDSALENIDALIHLAGEPVAQRWNADVKRRIRDSRVLGTRALVHGLAKVRKPPSTLICASAIGIYGNRGDEELVEQSPFGEGFLSDICREWESEAIAAIGLGVRVVLPRIGIVLGKEGGALKQMLPPFRLGAGGPIASGRQWMSWIHVDDLISTITFSLGNATIEGPVNATAPNPVRNAEFAKALGDAVGRPAIIPTPAFALRLLLGEAAQVVLASQRVFPEALRRAGFVWRYPDIGPALRAAV